AQASAQASAQTPAHPAPAGHETVDPGAAGDRLTAQNLDHLRYVADQAHAFAHTCRELTDRYRDPEELYAQEHVLVQLGRVSAELFSMAVVLARAARLAGQGVALAQELSDVFCAEA